MRFGPIGDLLRYILDAIYSFVPNYGWAVILFTLLIRLVLMPLDIKSKKSMKRMSQFQPQIDALNKKYANDREKLNQKMNELYRKEKINPLSGCLPMLLQMPILFAMFAVMREVADEQTVKMLLGVKDALAGGNLSYQPVFEGFFWIKNVFQPDSFMSTVVPAAVTDATKALANMGTSAHLTTEMITSARNFMATADYASWAQAMGTTTWYSAPMLMWNISIPTIANGLFILPIFAAISQFFASKLMPGAGGQQSQQAANPSAKSTSQFMAYFFPLFSIFICATSTASFALYWVAVNLIQLAQQLIINKIIDVSDQKKRNNEEATNP